MTVGDLLQSPKYTEKFVLQKLLCLFLECTREQLWTDGERQIDDETTQKIITAYDDYVVKKKPLEYVMGYVEFFGNKFLVNEATLIPRPETEYMITAVKEYISLKLKADSGKTLKNILLDIGTGCGVLGISTLLQNPGFFQEVIFTDYFADALAVAEGNYKALITTDKMIKGGSDKMKATFLQSDLLEFWNDGTMGHRTIGDIILVANLPYIPEETFDTNAADNVKKWEPRPAFVGGGDGLLYYRRMFDQLLQLSGERGKVKGESKDGTLPFALFPLTLFLEMMTRQVEILRQEYGQDFEFEEVKTFHFNIRIVKCWRK